MVSATVKTSYYPVTAVYLANCICALQVFFDIESDGKALGRIEIGMVRNLLGNRRGTKKGSHHHAVYIHFAGHASFFMHA